MPPSISVEERIPRPQNPSSSGRTVRQTRGTSQSGTLASTRSRASIRPPMVLPLTPGVLSLAIVALTVSGFALFVGGVVTGITLTSQTGWPVASTSPLREDLDGRPSQVAAPTVAKAEDTDKTSVPKHLSAETSPVDVSLSPSVSLATQGAPSAEIPSVSPGPSGSTPTDTAGPDVPAVHQAHPATLQAEAATEGGTDAPPPPPTSSADTAADHAPPLPTVKPVPVPVQLASLQPINGLSTPNLAIPDPAPETENPAPESSLPLPSPGGALCDSGRGLWLTGQRRSPPESTDRPGYRGTSEIGNPAIGQVPAGNPDRSFCLPHRGNGDPSPPATGRN